MTDFWHRLDNLIDANKIVIDRPHGTTHPRYPDVVYPLDYGYVTGTAAGDGSGVDVWQGSIMPPHLVAIVCTVDTLKADAEIKLRLGCTHQEIEIVNHFHNHGEHMSCIVVTRNSQDD